MSNKTVEDVLEFAKKKWDEADDAGHWMEANAYITIIAYLEDRSTALTPEEMRQFKLDISKSLAAIKRSEIDDEINKD